MRMLGLTTLVVAAALAVPSASAQVPPLPPLPPLPVPTPAVERPDVPPPVPTPAVPDLSRPGVALPVPTPVLPDPAPEVERPAPAPDAPPPSAAAAQGAAATPPPNAAAPVAPRAGGARPLPPGRRREGGRPARERTSRVAAPLAAAELPSAEAARATPTPERAEPPGPAARLADELEEIIRAVPAEILWALLGMATLALGLAGNAYWQSRRRAALETERAELLDDVGLLSSALLPALPECPDGLSVSAAYRPADGPAAGGDFYDVFALGERRLGVVLGDVSGHGRHSVRQAALARYTLRTLLAAGHAPGDALARADGLLARDLAPDFVTVIVAVYDEESFELTYAKAGHPPPIVLGTAYDPGAEVPACPLGLGLGDAWPEYRLTLGEGVTVCLFTDGLEDARTAGGRLGREGVQRLLAAQAAPDAAALLAGVRELADSVADDTAAVVLRRAQAAAAGTGSGRTMTVSSTRETSSAGIPVRSACSRTFSALVPS
jgi:hypothetical protein